MGLHSGQDFHVLADWVPSPRHPMSQLRSLSKTHLAVLALTVAVAAAAWWRFGRGPEITAVAAMLGTAVEIVYATGAVEPVRWAKVTSLMRNRIIEMCYYEGKTVAKGDVLVRLDDREPRAQLEELKAREEFAKREMERVAHLVGRGVATTQAHERIAMDLRQRDVGASVQGIDPHREPKVSMLATQMRVGTLASLYRASNAIILGNRLAEKIGARLGSNITVQTTDGARITAQVVGLFRSGIRSIDESTAYVLVKTAQILAQQTGLVNEIRVRVADPMAAASVAQRIERETGYKSVAWQEAHEDLLSAFIVRNIIMYTVVDAILMVASFGIYNIIHHAREDARHRHSEIARPARSHGAPHFRVGGAADRAGWGARWLGARVRAHGRSVWSRSRNPMIDATRLPLVYSFLHCLVAAAVALAASLVAGYFPARKASRAYPVDIIRGAT